jgi:hypothetical protein
MQQSRRGYIPRRWLGFSFSKGEKVGMRAGDKVLPASCRKIKLNNNTIYGPEDAKSSGMAPLSGNVRSAGILPEAPLGHVIAIGGCPDNRW